MSWLARKALFDEMARGIDPAIRIRSKGASKLMRAYSKIPWLDSRAFLTQTATVIGPIHWYPDNWSDISKELHHEGRHTKQQRWLGLGIHPWLGLIPFALAAVMLLPTGLTLRFWLEMDAETAALRYKYRTGSPARWVRHELVEFAERLAGPGYLWSWPAQWAHVIALRRGDKICGTDK